MQSCPYEYLVHNSEAHGAGAEATTKAPCREGHVREHTRRDEPTDEIAHPKDRSGMCHCQTCGDKNEQKNGFNRK